MNGKKKRKKAEEKRAAEKRVLGIADTRMNGMKVIEAKIDFGGGASLAALGKKKGDLGTLLEQEAKIETELVAIRVQIKNVAAEVSDLNGRTLAGVKARYGGDSEQYKQVGGTRKSEKKRSRKTSVTPFSCRRVLSRFGFSAC